jgi:hypothetical protein
VGYLHCTKGDQEFRSKLRFSIEIILLGAGDELEDVCVIVIGGRSHGYNWRSLGDGARGSGNDLLSGGRGYRSGSRPGMRRSGMS